MSDSKPASSDQVDTRPHLLDITPRELKARLKAEGHQSFRTDQVLEWAYDKFPTDFADMTNLSKPMRAWLEGTYRLTRLEEHTALHSKDGSTKYLWRLEDGHHIESVVMPSGKRWTLCMSSQVGCKMGCAFCITGMMGFKRQLKPHEISMQLLEVVARGHDVSNIVLMGMGEPLDNWENLRVALTNLTHEKGADLTTRRITLSTVGLAARMPEVLEAFPRLSIAVSLVAPTQELRAELLPVARKYPLDTLMETARSLPLNFRRRITFEYPILHGTNDRQQDQEALVKLLQGMKCKVNLIPFNPDPRLPFKRPPHESVQQFRQRLERAGLTATVRWSKALDIQGACGQLADRMQMPATA